MKKFTLMLCVCLTLFLCSCFQTQPVQNTVETIPTPTPIPSIPKIQTLNIPVSSKGVNPYLYSDILVEQPSHLLFEKIIEISPNFEIEYRIAKKIVSNGLFVEITINDGFIFADGSPITIQDVYSSLNTALNCERYSNRFSNVEKIEIVENTILITLYSPDSLFAYLLDIPVLKSSETLELYPTANGRYTYANDTNHLIRNTVAPYPIKSPQNIILKPVSNYNDMVSQLTLGNIDYSILSENSNDANISTTSHYYYTNTLLFLGANSSAKNPICNQSLGRILLSELINRSHLSASSSTQRTNTAKGAINPHYPIVFENQTISASANTENLETSMTSLGYVFDNETKMYIDSRGNVATVSILVHDDSASKMQLANDISEQLDNFGIKIELIITHDFNSFLTLLQKNQFELYIGEIKLYNNMELISFFAGSASYGINASETLLSAYAAFRADFNSALNFETAFANEMPYIPLLWRSGVVATDHSTNNVVASISNPTYSLEELTTEQITKE